MADRFRNDSPDRSAPFGGRYQKPQEPRYQSTDDKRQQFYNPPPGYEVDPPPRESFYQDSKFADQHDRRSPPFRQMHDRYDDQVHDNRREDHPRPSHPSYNPSDRDMPRRRFSRFDSDRPEQSGYPPRGYQSYEPSPYSQSGPYPYHDGPPGRSFRDPQRDNRDRRERDDRRPPYSRPPRDEPYQSSRPERREYQTKYSRLDDSRKNPDIDYIDDTVFVSNLPPDTTIGGLADVFGSIGFIKKDKRTGLFRIKIYTNTDGTPKGEASVSYDDAATVPAAIEWFNNSDFGGNKIIVQRAERTYSANYLANKSSRGDFRGSSSRGRGDRDRNMGDRHMRTEKPEFRGSDRRGAPPQSGGRGGPQRPHYAQPGDWPCSFCKNNNFAWRTACNRCNAPRSNEHEMHGGGPKMMESDMNMPNDPRIPDHRFREKDPRT